MAPSFLLSADLGTSHAVAVLRWPDGRTRPLLFDGQPVLPVGVYCDDAGELHVGRDAARLSAVSPDRFEPYPKRRVAQGTVLLADREVAVEAMFAAALRRIAVACAQVTGTLPETVLTCPSSWSSRRREVLAGAAARAGFGPVRLVTEPVAAAHYYSSVLGRSIALGEALAVVDFGAGTVDVAVLAAEGDGLAIVAEGGVDDFGGVDLDAAVVDHLRDATVGDHASAWAALDDPKTGSQLRGRLQLWTDVRETKEMLSRFTVAPVSVPGIEAGLHLTRTEFDAVARPLLEPVVAEVARARDASEAAGHRVGAVFLVGGASRMPLAATLIHQELGVAPVVIEQPELAVAEGAAAERDEAMNAEGAPMDRATTEPATEAVAEATPSTAPITYSPAPVPEPTPITLGATDAVLGRHPKRKPQKRTVVVGAVALVLVAAVLLVARPWLPGGSAAEEAPFAAELTGTAAQACPEGQSTQADPGTLLGPHFTLAPSCLTLLEPDEASAVTDLLGETPDIGADERLALAHFPAEGAVLDLPEGSEHRVATLVSLGEATWEAEGVPGADTVYAAVVGEDAALTVAVTDAERTQTLDLATGEIADPVAAYYHGEFGERGFTFESHLSMASPDGEWVIDSARFDAEFTVTRAVFDGAWLCDADEAVLTATFSMQVSASEHGQDWPYDASQKVRLETGDAEVIPFSVDYEDIEEQHDGPGADGFYRHFTLTFVVPADLVDVRFAVDPHDRTYEEGIDEWLYTASGGETKHYTVSFSS